MESYVDAFLALLTSIVAVAICAALIKKAFSVAVTLIALAIIGYLILQAVGAM